MSMANDAYVRISEHIESCKLQPGAELTESTLIEIAGTGRTPMREAVLRLTRDCWLETGRSRGVRVPDISVDDQLARLEVRRNLETLAVELATVRASDDQLAEVSLLVSTLKQVPDQSAYQIALRQCHELIGQLSNNTYLASALVPLQGLSRRFWLISTRDLDEDFTQARVLYVPSLEAVVKRDAQAARESILHLHSHLVESALTWARTRASQSEAEPPSPLPYTK